MKSDLRADAMWLAENWAVIGASEDASHPTWIRKTHRESQDATEPVTTPEPSAAVTTAATAVLKHQRRLAAVDAHRKGTGPEAITAQRQFAKTAEAPPG